jgi:hypothetical protein
MIEDQFGHFEHADSLFAIENFAQFVVCPDEGFIFGVLQIVSADVIPKLLRHFRARKGLIADDFTKLLVWLNGFQKSGTRLSFRFGLRFRHNSKPKGASGTDEMG